MKKIVKNEHGKLFGQWVMSGILQLISVCTVVLLGSTALADSGNFIWVANSGSNDVSKVDTINNEVVSTIEVGAYPLAVAVAENQVYIANRDDKTISVINKENDLVEAIIQLERHPLALAVGPDGYLHVVNTINTITYTPSNMAWLSKVEPINYTVVQELQLRTISNLDIGIGISEQNIGFLPYEFSWSMVSGCIIVDLNDYSIKGTYNHSPTTYGYPRAGVTIDSEGNGWYNGIRSSSQSSIIKITPQGERTYYRHENIGGYSDIVIDDDDYIWSVSADSRLVRINTGTDEISYYDIENLGTSGSYGLTYSNGYLWLVSTINNVVRKIDLTDGAEILRVGVGASPRSIGDMSGYEAFRAGLAMDISEIELDVSYTAEFTESKERHYYVFSQETAGFNRVTLDDTDDIGTNELYVKCGSLPSRSHYDFKSNIENSADQYLYVFTQEATSCYMLVCSDTVSGEYTITAESVTGPGVSSISPGYYGNTADGVFTISGVGFEEGTTVVLVDENGNEYMPEILEIDSLYQITVNFDLTEVPVNKYSVKVVSKGQEFTLANGFEVLETNKAELETKLILPSRFGRHAVATIYIEYTNSGNTAMAAPMLRLISTDSDDSDKPILTLDKSRVAQNLWAKTMPPGCGHTIQFLADGDGDSSGVLQPGESGRMAVYYLGLLQPWNFSDTKVELQIMIVDGEEPTSFSWGERKEMMKPANFEQEAWDIIFYNLVSGVGETWGDYISTLSDNSVYIYRHSGRKVNDTSELMRFEFLQAIGHNPIPVLIAENDMVVEAPGMPIVFNRNYSDSLIRRHQDGPLGKGWAHNWMYALEDDIDGNVVISYMGDRILYTLSSRGGYFPPAGNYSRLSKSGDIFTLTSLGGKKRVFNVDGTLDYIEDLNNNRITVEYNGNNLVGLQHSSGQYLAIHYDGQDKIINLTDHTGVMSVAFEYGMGDSLGYVRDIYERSTWYSYHQNGSASQALASIEMADGTEKGFEYDDNGRMTLIEYDNIPQFEIEYGHEGLVTITNLLDQASYNYFYDENGQFIKKQDPYLWATRANFDDNSNLTSLIQPDGATSKFVYDSKGNLIQGTNQLKQATYYNYGRNNRLVSFTDARSNSTSYSYDTYGNNNGRTSPDTSTLSYQHNDAGDVIQKQNRKGGQVAITRDVDGRIIRKDYESGNSYAYAYDEAGNVTSVEDSTGITSMSYYPNHLLRRIDYPGGRFLEYSYDQAGRRTSVVDQSGYQLNYGYDIHGNLETILVAGGGELARYEYDNNQRLVRKTLGNDVYTTYTYDLKERVQAIATYNRDHQEISSYQYDYDENDRRTQMVSRDGSWDYSYDLTGQLVQATFQSANPEIESKDIIYVYDEVGNRIEEIVNGISKPYSVNAMNQYSNAHGFTYAYDTDGNLISKTDGTDTWTYKYNEDNRLIFSSGPDGVEEYIYNGLGFLVTKIKDGIQQHYVIDPTGYGNVVGEYDDSGMIINRYTHGFGLLSKNDLYYSFDGSGNTSELTNNSNEIVNYYVYESFGKALYKYESEENDFEFVGQLGIRRFANDLTYMRNRFYSPVLGRFLSEDPIGLAGGDISFYRYVQNDPVNWVDPSGLAPTGFTVFNYFQISHTPSPSDLVSYHYNRNEFNESTTYNEAVTEWQGGVPAFFHQLGEGNEGNMKFISPNGHSEAIFTEDGKLVNDCLNGGTYNYSDPTTDPFGHFLYDMLPYFLFGNCPETKEE